jgi:hypothetical protein
MFMGAWVTGRNSPGCLPENELTAYATWADARDGLVADMRYYADTDDEAAYAQLSGELTAKADYPDYEMRALSSKPPPFR